jgi:hypothetical protein
MVSQDDIKRELKSIVMRKDDIQIEKGTESGYGEGSKEKTTKSVGGMKKIPSDKKESIGRGKKLNDYKHEGRCKTTSAKSGKPSSTTNEASCLDSRRASDTSSYDKKRQNKRETKKSDQKDSDENISKPNDERNSSSRSDTERTKSAKSDSHVGFPSYENKKTLQCNPKKGRTSSASVVRPPPGFDKIASNSGGPAIGAPPGFKKKDPLVGKPPPGL